MSDSAARQRLDTPRSARRFAINVDPEAAGRLSESFARFLGTGRYLAIQTVLVVIWILLKPLRDRVAVGSVSVHPAQPGVLDAGGLRGTADSAGPEPSGEPGPGVSRRGPSPGPADESRHRISGPRTGGAANRRRRSCHPRLPAPRTRGSARATGTDSHTENTSPAGKDSSGKSDGADRRSKKLG